ncbi:hypothetical protein AVEN_214123-1 [Araneus ventricosus]|uniref:Uncharacterized protein n=1 Tax=Araneus ventricosus TaxID=182803 RepID=A0A4Y2C6P0_ARAVE|nr:hypothetical protein AVEN_214123-1 [Araneus ventricosus]
MSVSITLRCQRNVDKDGLVVRSRLQGRRVTSSKPDFAEALPCMWATQRSYVGCQTSSHWCGTEASSQQWRPRLCSARGSKRVFIKIALVLLLNGTLVYLN